MIQISSAKGFHHLSGFSVKIYSHDKSVKLTLTLVSVGEGSHKI